MEMPMMVLPLAMRDGDGNAIDEGNAGAADGDDDADGCCFAEKRVKQRARWQGRKEDQGAAQAACVVGLLRSEARKRATACEGRQAAWGQERWAEFSRTHQVVKLPNADVDVVHALTAADVVTLLAAGEAMLPISRDA